MKNWWQKMAMKNYQFMMGRCGLDDFGKFLFIAAIILDFISLFIQNAVLSLIPMALLVWEIFRFYSRNLTKRSIENYRYRDAVTICRRRVKAWKMACRDHKNHYYLCPHCHQIVRIPRGHGKIEITCPSCHQAFEKKS